MRKPLSLMFVLALAVPAVALGAQPSPSPVQVKSTLTASRGVGTKAKPVPVTASYTFHVSTADGSRPEAVKSFSHAWEGVRSYGRYFPKCTIEQISKAQSDSVCPKGSLVGKGPIHSLVGADNDFSNPGAPCDREARSYNAGQDKVVVLFVGPGTKCLGTAYTPPYAGKWSNSGGIGGGQLNISAPPFETTHPVPGLLVSTLDLKFTFPKRVITVKGRKVSYLMSVGCSGKRAAREDYARQPSGKKTVTKTTAGRC